ncbi:MAG TPA: NHL repeat-containing protein, partial [Solirubrobacterales bacterium]|nr:NHL repeat-containing protein [Solirubrobacterales bacterium]
MAALTLAALALSAASAAADSTICPPGSGAGQCANPQGVASDLETGRVFVADAENNRVDAFKADGEFLFAFGWKVNKEDPKEEFQICTTATGCQKGSAGPGVCQFNSERRVAVDNTAGSPSRHDIYVYDSANKRVQKLGPNGECLGIENKEAARFKDVEDLIAVGPGGDVYVADILSEEASRIEKFNSSLVFLGECAVPHEDRLNGGFAVDSAENIYAKFNKSPAIFKFSYAEPTCGEVVTPPYPLSEAGVETRGLAVDGADNLYLAQRAPRVKGGKFGAATKYSPTGASQRRYGFGSLTLAPSGIAPQPLAPAGAVVSEGAGAVKSLVEPPPGPVAAPVEVSGLGNVRATLEAEVDPEGKASTYHFEYLTQKAYEKQGNSFAGPQTKSTPVTPLGGAADFALHLASAQIGCAEASKQAIEEEKCLTPHTAYRFRIEAENPDGKGNSPLEGSFETKPPVAVEETFASEVGADSARFNATVNPLGIPTTGYFEYVTQAGYEEQGESFAGPKTQKVPDVEEGAGPLGFGAGEAGVTRSLLVELQPGTTYHLRLVVSDPLIEPGTVAGEEVVFSTFKSEAVEPCPQNQAFRSGPSALLPDCRAYELVSPLDKEGGEILRGKESLGFPNGLAQSAASGTKLAYPTYRAFGDAKAAPLVAQYIAERGASGWQSHYVLGPRGRLNERTLLSRESELRALSPDLCEMWVKTYAEPKLAPGAVEGEMNLYRRHDQAADCGGQESWEAITTAPPPHGDFGANQIFEFQGSAADHSASIYVSEDNLTPDAPDLGGEGPGLYYQEEGEGQPHFVCYLPSGAPVATTCAAGTTRSFNGAGRLSNLTGAISSDGQRVLFSTPTQAGTGKIYLRERPGEEQSAVAGGACTEAEKACTIAVSAKGEELSSSTSARFWAADPQGTKVLYSTGSDLYLFEVETKTTTLLAHKALGVVGASTDLGRIYLASEEALGSEANSQGDLPVAGQANVYLAEGGAFRFVAGLAKLGEERAFKAEPAHHTARVTADGSVAALMSSRPLTGYDNTDAKNGEADSEVFVYEAAANGGKGKLLCASCNPSGGRPAGVLIPGQVVSEKFWAAAKLPPLSSSLHPGRFLSEDGNRLFFEAADALAPRDTNQATDVYQWEAPGTGSCTQSSASFAARDEGCVSLISSGQGAGEAEMLDASPSGEDVFFSTGESLLNQ